MNTYDSATTEIPQAEFGTCALVQDLLPLYLEGEVSPGSRDTIVEHLARCERCASFLAGAQSVRTQLRRDTAARERVIERDEPVRHVLQARQNGIHIIAMLVLCSLGALASLMLWFGLDRFPPAFPGGAILGLAAMGGLIAQARRQHSMALAHWVVLIASCMLGALGTVFIVALHQLPAMMIGMLLLMLALSGIWTTVFQSNKRIEQ